MKHFKLEEIASYLQVLGF